MDRRASLLPTVRTLKEILRAVVYCFSSAVQLVTNVIGFSVSGVVITTKRWRPAPKPIQPVLARPDSGTRDLPETAPGHSGKDNS